MVTWRVKITRERFFYVYVWIIEKNLVDLDIFPSRVLEKSGNMDDGKKRHLWVQEYPLFQKGGGVVLLWYVTVCMVYVW